MKQKMREEVCNEINSWQKAANYQGCPFKGYEKINPHRKDHPKVFKAIMDCLKEKEYDIAGKSVIDIGSNIGYFPFALRLAGAGPLNMVERQGRIQKIIRTIVEIENLENVEVLGKKMHNVEQAKELPKCDIVVYKSVHHWIKKFSSEEIAEDIFREITSEASAVIYEPCNFGKALPTDADNSLASRCGFDTTVIIADGFKGRDIQVCLRSK